MLIICTLTGIADSGSGVGILVFAPLTTLLVEAYGWKGTHLVFGGLSLGSILFASLMGPIVSKCQPNLKEENKQVHKKSKFIQPIPCPSIGLKLFWTGHDFWARPKSFGNKAEFS